MFTLAHWKPSSETQGQSVGPGEKALQKFQVLKNFCSAFSPGPTDRPWVSEDDWKPDYKDLYGNLS